MADMWFTVLGPVRVWRAGAEVDLGAPQQRTVLALLLVRAGHPVSLAEIVDVLWGDNPPATAVNAVHRSVGLLRRALEPGLTNRAGGRWLVRAAGGYRLDVDAGTADLLQFRLALSEARATADPGRFAQALDLWQGPVASTVAAEVRGQPVFSAVDREHEAAAREAAAAALAAGDPAPVLAGVERAAGEAPLDESLQARLMLLLAATGQRAAALRLHDAVRARLADDLGIEPGVELTAAWDQVRSPPAGPAPEGPAAQPAGGVRRVAQLPLNPATFTGREPELAAALELLEQAASAPTVPIGAISGMAGVGKTTLAVYWAHRVADRYPDGQLCLNLRGFGPTGQVMDPAEAVAWLLEALDVPPHRMPAGLDARAALFRSHLADRRMLVLLDNARDTAQVRPLLPGAPGSLVLVTSRDRLAGLIASDGARPITLGPFTAAESRQLLVRRLGATRVAADPGAAGEIVARCAGLPLALAIVAARAATHPLLTMRELAAELHDERGRLDTLSTGDPDSDVRTVFSWSYGALTPAAATLFRLLGLYPGPDIAAPAAASLTGLGTAEVRPLLAELVRTGLLIEHLPGRYTFHDLVRAYAAGLADADADADGQRHAAGARLLAHYLHTAHRAALLLAPGRTPITLAAPGPGTTPEDLTGQDEALAWFTAEYRVLQAFLDDLASSGADTHAWQLAWTLDTFQRRHGHRHEHVATRRAALAAAHRLGDATLLADTYRDLGHALSVADRHDEARTHFTYALDRYTELGDVVGQAHVERGIGFTYVHAGQHDKALRHCLRAEELFRAAGNRIGLAKSLNEAGFMHVRLGEPRPALLRCEQALAVFRELGDVHGEAACLDSLGFVHAALHDHRRAVACLRRAAALFAEVGDRPEEATALVNLGEVHHGTGDDAAAGAAWRAALSVLRRIEHPNADLVLAKLVTLPGALASSRGTGS